MFFTFYYVQNNRRQLLRVLIVGFLTEMTREDLLFEEEIYLIDTTFFNFLTTLAFEADELISVAFGYIDSIELVIN